ncbi:MAG: cupin domain-containing protein, partial [bacterium]|nr:cupin domain-containing protein [bacterium]
FATGQTLAYHRHPEADQVFFVLSGEGQFSTDDGVETVFKVHAGSIIIAPKNVWHKLVAISSDPLVACQVTRLPVTIEARNK